MKNTELSLIYDIKPISVNKAYATARNGRRYMTSDGKAYKESIAALTRNQSHKIKNSMTYGTEIIFYGDFFTLGGKPRKKDQSNFIKLLEDAVCNSIETYDGIGMDDSQIFESHIYKVHSKEDKIEFNIYCMKEY